MRGHGEGMVTGTSSQKVSRGRGFDNFEGDEETGTLSQNSPLTLFIIPAISNYLPYLSQGQ